MKMVGMTKGGSMIVELNLSEAKGLIDLARELEKGTLQIVPAPVKRAARKVRGAK